MSEGRPGCGVQSVRNVCRCKTHRLADWGRVGRDGIAGRGLTMGVDEGPVGHQESVGVAGVRVRLASTCKSCFSQG